MNIPFTRYWNLLVTYLRPQWPQMTALAALLFTGIGLQLVNPQVVRYFIDTARAGGDMDLLTYAAIIFLVVAFSQQVVAAFGTYVGEGIGWTATNALRADLTLHCLRLDMQFHNARTPGELIERIDGDAASLGNFFSQFTLRILGNILLLIGVLVLLLIEDWRIGAGFAVFSILSMAALSYVRNIAVPYWKEARQASADLFGFVEEQLSGTEDIRANGAGEYSLGLLYRWTGKRLDAELNAATINIVLRVINIAIYTGGIMLALTAGFYLTQSGAITIGTAYLIVHYTYILMRPLREITNQMEDLQRAGAGIGRIEELFQTHSVLKEVLA